MLRRAPPASASCSPLALGVMLIDQLFPQVVGARASLLERLRVCAIETGRPIEPVQDALAHAPSPLRDAGAFLDQMTGQWRYEFGLPFNVSDAALWGTHMWVEVAHLFVALSCAHGRLLRDQLPDFMSRLANPGMHQATLVEMIPANRVAPTTLMNFEVVGLGVGNRTVDWVVRAQDGRTVLLDVKSRSADFLQQAERMTEEGELPAPDHDAALLFRSVEDKYLAADPEAQLQGAWISTQIKQNDQLLNQAFNALDATKVHFAVFGDWEPDLHVLVRRDCDREYLLNLFRAVSSSRFVYFASDG